METILPEVSDDKAQSALAQARQITIRSSQDYVDAGAFRETLKAITTEIDETFDHLIEQAFRHHRSLTAEKKRHYEPIEEARRIIKQAMIAWDVEQDRIRREEQDRIEAENRKKAEDEQLLKAAAAEKQGDKEQAERILNRPIEAAPVILPKITPKVAGHVVREIHDGEVIDMEVLIKHLATHPYYHNLLQPNQMAIRQMAMAFKGSGTVPGIRFFSRKV